MSEKEYKAKCENMFAKNTILINENEQLKAQIEKIKNNYKKQRNKRIDKLQKENAKLKKEISILLSCKNCPENKGGYICDKEYNDKCLAQKIQYIKELKEQNKSTRMKKGILEAKLKTYEELWDEQQKAIKEKSVQIEQLSNDNHVLKTSFITQQEQIEKMKCCGNCIWGMKEGSCRYKDSCNADLNKWEFCE